MDHVDRQAQHWTLGGPSPPIPARAAAATKPSSVGACQVAHRRLKKGRGPRRKGWQPRPDTGGDDRGAGPTLWQEYFKDRCKRRE